MTQQVAVIGYPLRHSISPRFQQPAFDALGLDVRYTARETPPEELSRLMAELRQPPWLGLNVTVPHKQAVLPYLDELSPEARRIGAVNTIHCVGGRLLGYNTDAPGVIRALRQDLAFEPRGARAVLLGAGGSARAVAVALLDAGVRSLIILNRHSERAVALAADLRAGLSAAVPVEGGPATPEAITTALAQADLLVNCTTVGMRHGPAEGSMPVPPQALRPTLAVYDLVYNPRVTPLVATARAAGAPAQGGLSMLVYQGAISFEIWTGRPAPLEVMRQAAEVALPE
jgi:shikimate dehydrogenase